MLEEVSLSEEVAASSRRSISLSEEVTASKKKYLPLRGSNCK
jgi:hypothetical protein